MTIVLRQALGVARHFSGLLLVHSRTVLSPFFLFRYPTFCFSRPFHPPAFLHLYPYTLPFVFYFLLSTCPCLRIDNVFLYQFSSFLACLRLSLNQLPLFSPTSQNVSYQFIFITIKCFTISHGGWIEVLVSLSLLVAQPSTFGKASQTELILSRTLLLAKLVLWCLCPQHLRLWNSPLCFSEVLGLGFLISSPVHIWDLSNDVREK